MKRAEKIARRYSRDNWNGAPDRVQEIRKVAPGKREEHDHKYYRRELLRMNLIDLLNVLCYAYYVRDNNLVSDRTFDELEKLYTTLFGPKQCPMRGIEQKESYNRHYRLLYKWIRKRLRGEDDDQD